MLGIRHLGFKFRLCVAVFCFGILKLCLAVLKLGLSFLQIRLCLNDVLLGLCKLFPAVFKLGLSFLQIRFGLFKLSLAILPLVSGIGDFGFSRTQLCVRFQKHLFVVFDLGAGFLYLIPAILELSFVGQDLRKTVLDLT